MFDDPVTHDEHRNRYSVDISLDNPDSVTDAIIHSVANILDEPLIALPPLQQTVDTDALNRVFHSPNDSTSDISVSFEYCDFVVVAQSGRITFEPTQ